MYLDKEEKALATTDKFLSAVAYLGEDAMQHYGAAIVYQAEAMKHLEKAKEIAYASLKKKCTA